MGYYRGKRVYITGGSMGIGLETALMLSSFGANIAIFAKDERNLEKAFKRIESRKITKAQTIYALQMDVTDPEDVQEKIRQALHEFGIPEILINTAAVSHADYFENVTRDTFQQVLDTNLFGTRNVIAEVLPYMKQRGGQIVNVSSMSGLIGFLGHAAYSASKFALVGFSESLRNELKCHRIYVSVYCPPAMENSCDEYGGKTEAPPETEAMKRLTGVMSTPKAAWILLDGIEKKKFLIVPGVMSKIAYFTKRIYPEMSHLTFDLIARFSGRGRKANKYCR